MKKKILYILFTFSLPLFATDYPHNNNSPIKDWDVRCKSCHKVHMSVGPYLGVVNGNYNMCYTLCHNPSGDAKNFVIDETKKANPGTGGIHHSFDVPGDNSGYDASTSSATYKNYYMTEGIDAYKIVCSTCHEQHNHNLGKPFLMADPETMCRDCHSPRNQNTPIFTSHPVGVPIPNTPDYQTPTNLPLVNGTEVGCTTCHDVHFAYSDTSYYGTATSGSTTSLTDNSQNWTPNKFVGWIVKIYPAGADTGNWFQIRTISSNTSNTISWNTPLYGTGIISGNKYVIRKPGNGNGYLLNQPFIGLCENCHTYSSTSVYSGIHLNTTFGARWPGGQYGSDYAYVDANGNLLPPARAADATPNSPLPVSLTGSCLNCHWPHGWSKNGGGKYERLLVEESGISEDPSINDEKLCLTCHDGSPVTPNIDSILSGTMRHYDEGTGRAVNTHHDIRLSEKAFSGAKIPCVACHNPHKIGRDDPSTPRIREDLINPDNPSQIWQYDPATMGNWGGATDEERTLTHFCLVCHDGDFPPTVQPPSVPLINIKIYWDPNDGQGPDDKMGPAGRDIPCTVCHDPHGSYRTTQPYNHNEQTKGNLFMLRDSIVPVAPDGTPYYKDNDYRNGKRTWVDSTSANNAVWNPRRNQWSTQQRVFFANFCDVCHAGSGKLDMQSKSCSDKTSSCHWHGSGKF